MLNSNNKDEVKIQYLNECLIKYFKDVEMSDLIDGRDLRKSYLDYGLKCINTSVNGISINDLKKYLIAYLDGYCDYVDRISKTIRR